MSIITKENIEFMEKKIKLENEDQKQDSQLRMVWFSLISSILYPILVIISDYLHLDNASKNLSEMSDIYFISVMGVVSVYFGSNAYKHRKSNKEKGE